MTNERTNERQGIMQNITCGGGGGDGTARGEKRPDRRKMRFVATAAVYLVFHVKLKYLDAREMNTCAICLLR